MSESKPAVKIINPAIEAIRFSICIADCDLLGAYAVRSIVFMDEQRCPFDEEFDELDRPGSQAIHIVGKVLDEPVAAARIRPLPGAAKLERLCIRRPWRGHGNGNRLLDFMINTAQDHGFRCFTLNAQVHLIEFYEAQGFTVQGPVFQEAGIDHRMMIRQ